MIVCIGCNGRKQISPLGGIVKTCEACKGIGYTVKTYDESKLVVTLSGKKYKPLDDLKAQIEQKKQESDV